MKCHDDHIPVPDCCELAQEHTPHGEMVVSILRNEGPGQEACRSPWEGEAPQAEPLCTVGQRVAAPGAKWPGPTIFCCLEVTLTAGLEMHRLETVRRSEQGQGLEDPRLFNRTQDWGHLADLERPVVAGGSRGVITEDPRSPEGRSLEKVECGLWAGAPGSTPVSPTTSWLRAPAASLPHSPLLANWL